LNALEATNHYIGRASALMELGARVERLLLSAEAEHRVSLPIELDNGDLAVFTGYRIQHSSARGPMKEASAEASPGAELKRLGDRLVEWSF
jgi:glutamate dehydrogenase (NAD(P)+)